MTEPLALHGGRPVRPTFLPYGRASVDDDDVNAVIGVLRSDWLTTGPAVGAFEDAFARRVGAKEAVSFSSGTAALHGAAHAAALGPGDEAVTTPMTFAATANSVLYLGARPVFADVEEDTLNLDPNAAREMVTPRTKAVIPVDYAGHPADLDAFRDLAEDRGLVLIEDACHALGATYRGQRVGSIAHLSVFSFHPVKHITTGEGGIVTTDSPELAGRLRRFRNHGITTDARERNERGTWLYEMTDLGFNYRLTDIACALGLSQLRKLDSFLSQRRRIASRYDKAFRGVKDLLAPAERPQVEHAWHLYPVRFRFDRIAADRDEVFRALRAENIGVNVHYIPVHLHPYYRHRFGLGRGLCPIAEQAFDGLVTLPLFPAMTNDDVEDVVAAVMKVLAHYAR